MTHIKVMKQALEALEEAHYKMEHYQDEEKREQAITALKQGIAQDALDKKAENARELGLDYEPAPVQEVRLWAVFCGGCRKEWSVPYQHPGKSICAECEAKCKDTPPAQPAPEIEGVKLMQMLGALVQKYSDQLYDGKGAKAANDFELDVAAIRLTVEAQSAPVQEPVAYDKTEMNCFVQELYDKKMCEGKHGHYETMFHCVHQAIKRVTPPAAQKQWVGLTDDEIKEILWNLPYELGQEDIRAIEAKLKEKNHG